MLVSYRRPHGLFGRLFAIAAIAGIAALAGCAQPAPPPPPAPAAEAPPPPPPEEPLAPHQLLHDQASFLRLPNLPQGVTPVRVGIILPMLFIQNIVFFGVPAAFIRWKYQLPLREIGMPPLPNRRQVLQGVGLGLLAIMVSMPLEYGLKALAEHFRYLPWVAAGLKMEQSLPINALIESVTTTTFVSDSYDAVADRYGAMVLFRKGREDLVEKCLAGTMS